MRAIFLTTLVVLLAACGSPSVTGRELASSAPATDSLASSSSTRRETGLPEPYLESAGDTPRISSGSSASASATAESPVLVPLGMTVPLLAWNSEHRAYELQLVDPATGNPFPDWSPMEVGRGPEFGPTLSLSPDGSKVALITGHGLVCEPSGIGHACWRSAKVLRLVELRTRREVTTEIPTNPPANGWVWPVVFSRDGERLAAAYHDRTPIDGLLIGQNAAGDLRFGSA